MHTLKEIVKKTLYFVNNNPIGRLLYANEIERRAILPITNIIQLSKHISMFSPYTHEISPINDWYGHAKVLKKYTGLQNSQQFKFVIEHGTYLSEQIAEMELQSTLPSFVTYSNYRMEILKKHRQFVYAIGPMINYTNTHLNNKQLLLEKKNLGKTLLYFPSHSLIGLTNTYNQKWSCDRVKELAKKFDTVRVCVYWKDVLLGMHHYYQKLGWECVTAGHILDSHFLSRVKSIIQLADLTVSNDASSPLSYCVAMDKPHIIIYQRPQMSGSSHLKRVMVDYWKSEPYQMFIKEFSQTKFCITSKQRQLANFYLGTNIYKTKKEILTIVKQSENNYKKTFPVDLP